MAHLGVLEVLEELDVPVDAIVGTSMGAVVGGMYAAGLSPDQMREDLQHIDWHSAFDDSPPRKYVPFRRKEDDLVALFKLETGYNKKRGILHPGRNRRRTEAELHPAFDVVAHGIDRLVRRPRDSVPGRRDRPRFGRRGRDRSRRPPRRDPGQHGVPRDVHAGQLRRQAVDRRRRRSQPSARRRTGNGSRENHRGRCRLRDWPRWKSDAPTAMQVLRRTSSIQTKTVREEVLQMLREQDVLIRPELDGVITFSDFDAVEPAIRLGREAAMRRARPIERVRGRTRGPRLRSSSANVRESKWDRCASTRSRSKD